MYFLKSSFIHCIRLHHDLGHEDKTFMTKIKVFIQMTSDKAADLLFRAQVKRTGQPLWRGKVKSKMPRGPRSNINVEAGAGASWPRPPRFISATLKIRISRDVTWHWNIFRTPTFLECSTSNLIEQTNPKTFSWKRSIINRLNFMKCDI